MRVLQVAAKGGKSSVVRVPENAHVVPAVSTALISRGLVTIRPPGKGASGDRPLLLAVPHDHTVHATDAHALELACVRRPLHAAAISGFGRKFPTYCSAVKLAWRWVSAHMFGDHLTFEAVELLVAVSCRLYWIAISALQSRMV
jgi:hypothetical protein